MNTSSNQPPLDPAAARLLEESLSSVREALTGLKYGAISLTVHEGRVVQIDVTEKKRLKPN
ncbi:MAG: YezD family protein [Sphingomonadales bacterium]|nr:YezD family protein [Sphingomonadales bacterium]